MGWDWQLAQAGFSTSSDCRAIWRVLNLRRRLPPSLRLSQSYMYPAVYRTQCTCLRKSGPQVRSGDQ
eukprot:scaffold518_cov388-Prasinococcus_capsulatus_cf.AAC.33